MEYVLQEYFPIVVFLVIATGLSFIVMGIPFLVALRRPDKEKNSPYECGFEPFSDARGKFDVRFYLVSILFIIFDLEIAFLAVLTVGFIYEWKKGGLEWE